MNTNLILKHLNLLVVDDNQRLHSELYTLFSSIFKTIALAHDLESALHHYETHSIDIIITDIVMPGMDGLNLIEAIRSRNSVIPIIVLSAHTERDYLLRAANLQIDGYITKPLNFRKLEASLARAATRLQDKVKPVNLTESVSYNPLLKSLIVDNQEVSLGAKECLLLEYLLHNQHRVVGKAEIQETVWPSEVVSDSALKNLLGELRRKLKYDVIKNQPSRGWTIMMDSP